MVLSDLMCLFPEIQYGGWKTGSALKSALYTLSKLVLQLQMSFHPLPLYFRLRPGQIWDGRHQPTSGTQNVDQKPEVETEVEIPFERYALAKRFQRLPLHFRPCPT